MAEHDTNKDHKLGWSEFLEMFKQLKIQNSEQFGKVISIKAGEISQTVGESGFTHTYFIEERICFAKLVNEFLQGDEDCKEFIPINPENDDLFHCLETGVVLAKLVNIAVENTILPKAINTKKNMNIYQTKENLNLAINACKGIGLKLPGIKPEAFIEKKPHLILAVMW